MSFFVNREGRLAYVLKIKINCLEFNPKYPKNPQNFGQRLRKKRMDLGLTMKEVADKIGVTESTVSNWERRNIRPYRKAREKLKELYDLEEIPVQAPV
jgi:ribosome-binding protein aMBF1 (putative translation factor)